MTQQTEPRPGTRRRKLYDMLMARPGEWIEFVATDLGYTKREMLHTDLDALRYGYGLDIRTAGRPGMCRWRYVP